jgi:hypothetical protein
MKTNISIYKKWFWLDFGWYENQFRIFEFAIFDIWNDYHIVIFSICIAKFVFAFGWQKYFNEEDSYYEQDN